MPRVDSGKGKKAKLIEAAVRLFVKKGYENTSLKDLANTVGIQAPAIYYYFKSKREILREIVDASWDKYRELVMDKVVGIDDPEERIKSLIRLMVAFQFEMGETTLLFEDPIPAVRALPGYRKHALEAKSFRQKVLQEFAESQARDAQIPVDVLNFALLQLVTGLQKRLKLWKGSSLEELTENITRLFFYGCSGFKPGTER
jgi:AcrR family transcriptional regulator